MSLNSSIVAGMAKKPSREPSVAQFRSALDSAYPAHPPGLAVDLDDFLWQVSQLADLLMAFRDAPPRTGAATQIKRLREIEAVSDYMRSVVRDVRKGLRRLP